IKDLENHASPANADECKQLNVLKTKLTNVYQLIRYSRSPEQYVRIQTELTDLHHTLEEQFKNVDHPFKEAIEHSVEILEIICKEEGKTLTPQGPKRK
ncbi:MAG TPA: hypothetical protein VHD33_03795, partial [Legionellaceae bacterium]|nr:hypothetical protein [Legionellaceae bacterium]